MHSSISLSVHSFCELLKGLAIASDFVAKFVKLADPTLFRHAGVPKWIAISQFRFQHIKWQRFLYILKKFGEIWSSNPEVYDVEYVQLALLPPLKKEVMFLVRSVCLFVCLFVCLSVGLLANL